MTYDGCIGHIISKNQSNINRWKKNARGYLADHGLFFGLGEEGKRKSNAIHSSAFLKKLLKG